MRGEGVAVKLPRGARPLSRTQATMAAAKARVSAEKPSPRSRGVTRYLTRCPYCGLECWEGLPPMARCPGCSSVLPVRLLGSVTETHGSEVTWAETRRA